MNGWIDWAVKHPGPKSKQYREPNRGEGIVCHSVEGTLAGALGELDRLTRQASWHFTNAKDGTLYQHYPLEASCWASGNFEANTRYVAIESEGKAGELLTHEQLTTALQLFRELGFTTRGVNVWEHNEVATKWQPNAGPTSCPSGRYDGVFEALEDRMTPEQEAKLDAVYKALTGGVDGVIEAWNENGNSVLVAYNDIVFPHINNHPAGQAAEVAEHKHQTTVQTITSGGVVR